MFLLCLFVITSVLWQEDFTEGISTMSQLYDYTITISHEDGKIYLEGEPQFESFASAWFYVDEDLSFTEGDVLELVMKVNSNSVQMRYFYRQEDRHVYFSGEKIISSDEQWQKVEIPFAEARPFYGSDFPAALTPGKTPCLYIFISNELPGELDVEIDRISIFRSLFKKEEL